MYSIWSVTSRVPPPRSAPIRYGLRSALVQLLCGAPVRCSSNAMSGLDGYQRADRPGTLRRLGHQLAVGTLDAQLSTLFALLRSQTKIWLLPFSAPSACLLSPPRLLGLSTVCSHLPVSQACAPTPTTTLGTRQRLRHYCSRQTPAAIEDAGGSC